MSSPKISVQGDVTSVGGNARVEYGRARIDGVVQSDVFCWYVYQAIDVSADTTTTETVRWEQYGTYDSRDDAISAALEFAA